MTQTEALKLALEALQRVMRHGQAVQEAKDILCAAISKPQRPWVGLTDEERGQVINANFGSGLWSMAKDIEAKLKDKNT